MTTESGEAPNERKESQRPTDRGGAAGVDRSKSPDFGDDSPFGSQQKDTAEPKEEAPGD